MPKAIVPIQECHQSDKNKELFSDYLVRKGVLSSKMLHQLQTEFLRGSNSTDDSTTSSNNEPQKQSDDSKNKQQQKKNKKNKKTKRRK